MNHPHTIGTVTDRDGTVYAVDWPPTLATADRPKEHWERDEMCVIYAGGRCVADFINPDWSKRGFDSISDAMAHAEQFILSGAMRDRFEGADHD